MAGILARMIRASLLEVLVGRTTCERLAPRASREPTDRAAFTHSGTRSIPVITVLGLQFGALLAGSVITETIFSWPGIGKLLIDAIGTRDFPVVQGVVLAIALSYVLVNTLVTDLVYAWADPNDPARGEGRVTVTSRGYGRDGRFAGALLRHRGRSRGVSSSR